MGGKLPVVAKIRFWRPVRRNSVEEAGSRGLRLLVPAVPVHDEGPQLPVDYRREAASHLPVHYGAPRGCQWGHMAARPLARLVMRHSFLSPKRIT